MKRAGFVLLLLFLAAVSFVSGLLYQHGGGGDRGWPGFESKSWQWPWYNHSGEVADPVDSGQLRDLKGLGYLSGYEEAGDREGVLTHDTPLAGRGLNLYTSGHGPEAVLMDMNGRVVHRWRMPWDKAFPNASEADVPHHWRNFYLYENGDLLAIFERYGIVKIDRHSNLIWARRNGAHHDVWVAPSGTIYVLTARMRGMKSVRGESVPMVEDVITKLNENGKVLERYSLIKAIGRSRYAGIFDWARPLKDVLHTNALQILTPEQAATHPAFEPGDALVSMNTINVVGVIDLETNRLKWILPGLAFEQHDPGVLSNGNILMFDNNGKNWRSRVLEVDPVTQQLEWKYTGKGGNRFHSRTVGAVQRLANGNTLIVDTTSGRAFEVTPRKEIVWEFVNPAEAHDRAGKIASLFSMRRVRYSYVNSWLESGDH